MRRIGYSTGALALGDFRRALSILAQIDVNAIELSALRLRELDPLIDALDQLDLKKYGYVAVHGPADFAEGDERQLVERLKVLADRDWLIVMHPDTIHNADLWLPLEAALCFENMDKRKPIGRTAAELEQVFKVFDKATFCFDIGHAHQVDRTMSEARLIVQRFVGRLRQLHVSEVNTFSQHRAVTAAAKYAFRKVLDAVPEEVPLIIESVIPEQDVQRELDNVRNIFRQRTRQLLETD